MTDPQPSAVTPADADATAEDQLIEQTDNSASPDQAEPNQDPSVDVASDTDTPQEVTR